MKMPQEKPQKDKRSPCPVACTLDILGDKWTLLVIRDLFLGKRTYNEFLQSPEGIPTNILAERLKRLHRAKIIEKKKYQPRPARYHYQLTAMGKDLWPVLQEVMQWGCRYIKGTMDLADIQKMLEK